MIYSVEQEKFPKEGQYVECHSYNDENEFEWKIARVENGFFVGYFGDAYFKDKYFDFDSEELGGAKRILLNNTGCFFIKDTEFETFYEFRNILTNGDTDDIWDCIGEFFAERLTHDRGLTECEIVKK